VAFLVICVVWSATYLAIRVALTTIPPFPLGGIRWTIAGALLVATLRTRGEPLPSRGQWPTLAGLGALLIATANGGVLVAERTIPSGLTALLVAISPFWMVSIDAAMPAGERLTWRRVAGLALGFSGIVLLVWPEVQVGGRGVAVGVLATQVGCCGWATGSILSRHRGRGPARDENVLMTAACEMFCGGLVFLLVATVTRQWSVLAFTPRTLGALAYLVLAGSMAGFSAYAYALKHLPVAVVSLYAYINPVAAVWLGTVILGEPFSPRIALAAGVVLAGVSLVQRSPV
jgi:drug/metabolite transporter (DMT)-like permease